MDMIVHQDESVDSNGVLAASFTQQAVVVMAIVVVDEDGTAVDAPLGDMHWQAG